MHFSSYYQPEMKTSSVVRPIAAAALSGLAATAVLGCSPRDTAPPPDVRATAALSLASAAEQQPAFYLEDGVLYRRDEAGIRPLFALDSASAPPGTPVLPAEWRVDADAVFRVKAERLLHVVPSPALRWVAWETNAVHDLLGVVPAAGGPVKVLDFFFDSSADSLRWAPGDRYLAAFHLPPSGYRELRVYDAERGVRLVAPWDEECAPASGCEVRSGSWTGPTTLTVTTSGAEPARRYTVNARQLPADTSAGS